MGNASSMLRDVGDGLSDISKKIESGVGAVGQSVGDLFYSDNPERRKRVKQLTSDIETMQAESKELKQKIDELLAELKTRVDELLKEQGYSSVEEMDQKMHHILTPDTLAEWNEFKKTLNRDIEIENLTFAATGLLTIATGIISYGLALCGVITFASAGTALEVAGAIALVLGAVVVVLAIIDAGQERGHLREALQKLAPARVDAKQSLEAMRIYLSYVNKLKYFLSSNIMSKHPELFEEFVGKNLREAYEAITRDKVIQQLADFDKQRSDGAWKDEEPSDQTLLTAGKDPVKAIIHRIVQHQERKSNTVHVESISVMKESFNISSSQPSELLLTQETSIPVLQWIHEDSQETDLIKPQKLRLVKEDGHLDCDAEDVDTGEMWCIKADLNEKPTSNINIKDVTFTLTNTTKNLQFTKCKILLLGHL